MSITCVALPFQETHPERLFRECSHSYDLVSQPEQMPRVLEIAVQTAVLRCGVSVVVLPDDIALRPAAVSQRRLRFARPTPSVRPSDGTAIGRILRQSSGSMPSL